MNSNLVIDADFDEKTIEELNILREIRLGLAQKQLVEADATIDEMIRRNLIEAHEREELLVELKEELQDKIEKLSNRVFTEASMIHYDEVDMYLDLI